MFNVLNDDVDEPHSATCLTPGGLGDENCICGAHQRNEARRAALKMDTTTRTRFIRCSAHGNIYDVEFAASKPLTVHLHVSATHPRRQCLWALEEHGEKMPNNAQTAVRAALEASAGQG